MAKYVKKDAEQKKKEIEELTNSMEEQMENYFESPEQLKEYLTFMGQFHNYSASNIALMQRQFPGAQAVASFKVWKDKGFSVNKGEKGIKILVPNRLQPSFRDENGEWKKLKEATDTEKKKIALSIIKPSPGKLYFSLGHVFDVSQTNATKDDLPAIFPNKWLEGKVPDYQVLFKGMQKVAATNEIRIIEPLSELGAAKGVSYSSLKAVALNPRNSELQNVKTLLHELTHAKLHNTENRDKYTSVEKEFQAELTAFTVCANLGIDTSEYSLKYLANWTKGKELKDKTQLMKEVHETSLEFINTIENVVVEGKKKGQDINRLPVKEVMPKRPKENDFGLSM